MSIELRHLRYFLAVADELHFGRAAERLGMSQPPLSQQIRQLETLVGARLFNRTNRRVSLTDAGKLFMREAHAILAQVDHAIDLAQRAQRGEVGELRIGFTRSTPLSGHIPRAIFAFREAAPSVQLQLKEMNSLRQIDALLDHRLQVGIVRGNVLPETLVSKRLFRDPLVAVLREDHPATASASAKPGGCAPNGWRRSRSCYSARSAGAGIHDHVITLCRNAGFTPRVVQDAHEASTIVGLVAAGLGVSILPASCENIGVAGVAYVPLSRSGRHVGNPRGASARRPLAAGRQVCAAAAGACARSLVRVMADFDQIAIGIAEIHGKHRPLRAGSLHWAFQHIDIVADRR